MSNQFTFDDVLIQPEFSHLRSRKDVSLSCKELGIELPIISANMDTVTGKMMALHMRQNGGIGCLHRFWSIEKNVDAARYAQIDKAYPIGSIGLGNEELDRAEALINVGCTWICIDVAHGAQIAVVEQLNTLWNKYGDNVGYIVGNFGSISSIDTFKGLAVTTPIFKVGIGPGSACTTRIKTGIGYPQLSAVQQCSNFGINKVIADGGMKTPGDIAKAIAAGACAVMVGGMLSGTRETPGDIVDADGNFLDHHYNSEKTYTGKIYKKYRGSASKEAYEDQGKESSWRTAEGESFIVPYKGEVSSVLKDMEGGLRSSLTYVGANSLEEYREKAKFVFITGSSLRENGAHGKTQ